MTPSYPKRLIEVDLPIKRISAHARREKSIRHGHISTLHIWWARRPLAACRAVILAALWPDPADPLCPPRFLDEARKTLRSARGTAVNVPSGRSETPYDKDFSRPEDVRAGLLDFIAEFANWDHSTNPDYLAFARHLVQVAHEALGGEPGTRPLVVDPFAGGGSIPLEALRVGADAFASDLNPVAVLLNKVVLEYIPRYGQRLADEVRKWGAWIKEQAEKELLEFYPNGPDGGTPIAYFWARTIKCEGPGCDAQIPLIRSTKLSERNPIAHVHVRAESEGVIQLDVCRGGQTQSTSTVMGGKATCPRCYYTTPASNVKRQTTRDFGGANTARLYAVLEERDGIRSFRAVSERDTAIMERIRTRYSDLETSHPSLLPREEINPLRPYKNTVGVCIVTRLGIKRFVNLYNYRQILCINSLQRIVRFANLKEKHGNGLGLAIETILYLAIDRVATQNSSLSRWNPSRSTIEGLFSKQALQIIWDFVESNPLGPGMANWMSAVEWTSKVIEENKDLPRPGIVDISSANKCPLPDDSADMFFTDPPYFAAIPYADLSDVFFVWLKRALSSEYPTLFTSELTDKEEELVVTNSSRGPKGEIKDATFFSAGMGSALDHGRSLLKPGSIGCIVFADSSTSAWESMLSAVLSGGWVVTASWPIGTERQSRTRAIESASLQSSIFLICRPRENADGSLRTTDVGEWRDVLDELPQRIRDWMPRLDRDGVSGADAIFACLGPALEIFSRYSRVERADGMPVTLREYLEQVWAAVAREALTLVFEGADASGLEADARLTAMWLWTLRASSNGQASPASENEAEDESEGDSDVEEDEIPTTRPAKGGFSLEFDAARKIAQGLGAHLETLGSVVEVKGQTARLLPVAERQRFLFDGAKVGSTPATTPGSPSSSKPSGKGKKGRKPAKGQQAFSEGEDGSLTSQPVAASGADRATVPDNAEDLAYTPGVTTLDRVHQAMLMFGRGRSEKLARFIKEEGAGADPRFWRLAQSLSALYPAGSDEKRWVDGVLARKKGLGF
jgi:adenine-specific DNA methylase